MLESTKLDPTVFTKWIPKTESNSSSSPSPPPNIRPPAIQTPLRSCLKDRNNDRPTFHQVQTQERNSRLYQRPPITINTHPTEIRTPSPTYHHRPPPRGSTAMPEECNCGGGGGNRKSIGIIFTVIFLGTILAIFFGAYFLFGDTSHKQTQTSLRMVSIIFRHGDRSPTELYPTDPHANYDWPGGLGALSQKGSLQLYSLGKNLRKLYQNLLPSSGWYTKENIYLLSSAAERCLMSAASFMAGFMPPIYNQNPLPFSWQPVPINSMPRDRDYLLAQKKPCPKYDQLYRELIENPNATEELAIINSENAVMYNYLTKHAGKNINNILQVEFLYNTLDIEKKTGLELPDWTKEFFPKKMHKTAERSLALITETEYMKKVKGGALLTDIFNHMIDKRRKTLIPNRSLFIYSAHDVTLVNIMRALNIVNQTSAKPDYAASLVFELHDIGDIFKDKDYEIRIQYFQNSDIQIPTQIQIPNCTAPCALNQFAKSIETVILNDYDETCRI